MASDTIVFAGIIDLGPVNTGHAASGGASPGNERGRRSRLNDVMIVLERDRDGIEHSLRDGVSALGSENRSTEHVVDTVSLTVDDKEPRFQVALLLRSRGGAQSEPPKPPSRQQLADWERRLAQAMTEAIEARAANGSARRWQPLVTVTRPEEAERQGRRRMSSRWSMLLFLLLAIVIAVGWYLMFNHPS
ncbi:MAG: hypothetical protein KKB37_14860 [Alphaproteobacteria bacterium]|nr:hypothetical protein [Alphaproteobacteria bacterium]